MTGRRYAHPAAFKQALEERLRSRATTDGVDVNRVRQLLVFDRFLARLAHAFGEHVVLKGGLALELRLKRARTTKDVDLRLTGSPEELLPRLQEAGDLDLGDCLRFEVVADSGHPDLDTEGMRYQGQRFRAQARFAGVVYGGRFGVDVAFAEPMTGVADVRTGTAFLGFAGIAPATVRVYPRETHIAEKLHAYTLPRDRPNSRVKDLPDIGLLASTGTLESALLRQALEVTFRHRATHALPSEIPPPPDEWAVRYARMADLDGLRWASLPDLSADVAAFLDPVLAGATGTWGPERWEWRS